MKKEVFIVGTRPEIIKMAPILKKMKKDDYLLIHTGQHSTLANEAFETFEIIPDHDLKLMSNNQSLVGFIRKGFNALSLQIESIRNAHEITHIWVQGDTATAYLGSLIAELNSIPVVHVEAGLRTFDKKAPFPEEMFRTAIDSTADILFTPTEETKQHLKNVTGQVYVTGNTIVDALEMMKPLLMKESPFNEPYVLATIHRRESFGDKLIEIFTALKELSSSIKIVIPAHPNPNVREALKKVGLDYIEPLSYIQFLSYLKFCEYVITDSGGVQEEAPSFQKKTIVLREKTERTEAITAGMSVLIPELKKEKILMTIKGFINDKKKIDFSKNPFGDGTSANKMIEILK